MIVLVLLLNVPDAPVAGAVNVTLTPAIGFPATSFTVTESGVVNAVWIAADCGVVLAPAVILCGTCATLIWPLVPVMDEITVSAAVMVWLPAVTSVAANVPVPELRVELAGKVAAPSLLVKCTVPA